MKRESQHTRVAQSLPLLSQVGAQRRLRLLPSPTSLSGPRSVVLSSSVVVPLYGTRCSVFLL